MSTTNDPRDTVYAAAIAYAEQRGAKDGQRAAEGIGNDWDAAQARYVLAGIEDGTAAEHDWLPAADLSGMWADQLTGPELVGDALRAARHNALMDPADDSADDWYTAICDAYEQAYNAAAEDQVRAECASIIDIAETDATGLESRTGMFGSADR